MDDETRQKFRETTGKIIAAIEAHNVRMSAFLTRMESELDQIEKKVDQLEKRLLK